METIFEENRLVGMTQVTLVRNRRPCMRVERDDVPVQAHVLALKQRALKTVATRAEAIREAVQLADAWYSQTTGDLFGPDLRDDATIIARACEDGCVVNDDD